MSNNVIVFLGAPGSGKGTQSSMILKKYQMKGLSLGNILRSEIEQGTKLGVTLSQYVTAGLLVPDSLVGEVLDTQIQALRKEKGNATGILLDGFPRTLNQAVMLDSILAANELSLTLVIELYVNQQILLDRLLSRFSCAVCGQPYNKKFNLPKVEGTCDICGSHSFSYRKDDNDAVIQKRLDEYYEYSELLKNFYSKQNLLFTVDGTASIEHIFNEIDSFLHHKLNSVVG